jgi:hypothetical protein
MRLKSWESPRKMGRNDKSKQASARLRQLKKQSKTWKKKLQASDHNSGAFLVEPKSIRPLRPNLLLLL